MAHLLLFLSLSSEPCADLPLYPGATLCEAKTRAVQAAHPDSIVYVTPDEFGRVHAFYRWAGREIPSPALRKKGVEHAAFVTADRMLAARVAWVQDSADPGTTITYLRLTSEE